MGIVRKFIEFVRNKIITRRGFAPGTITKIMAKYILSKKAKGKKYQYTVTDEKGNVISTRTSARDYVGVHKGTDRVQYVEGKTNVFIPIDHAFNRVGNKYIDITFEFALGFLDPTQYEYVAFGEYPAGVIEEITDQTGYYGNIYRFCYCAAQMALEKMNPRT